MSLKELTAHWSCEWKWPTVWTRQLCLERFFWPTALCVCVDFPLPCWSQEPGSTPTHVRASVKDKRKLSITIALRRPDESSLCVRTAEAATREADGSSYRLSSNLRLLLFSLVCEILKREIIHTPGYVTKNFAWIQLLSKVGKQGHLQFFYCASVSVHLLRLSLNIRVNRLHLAEMCLVELFKV